MERASVLRTLSPKDIKMKYAMDYLSEVLERAVLKNLSSVVIVLFEWAFLDLLDDIVEKLTELGYDVSINDGVLEIKWEE